MSVTDIKKGDRVRVTVEGEVTWAGKLGAFDIGDHYFARENEFTPPPTIEKIEPPVEVFKPGDVVRQKAGYRYIYLIRANGGFTSLTNGGREYDHPFKFTSTEYERVDLSALTG